MLTNEQKEVFEKVLRELESISKDYGFPLENKDYLNSNFKDGSSDIPVSLRISDSLHMVFKFYPEPLIGFIVLENANLNQHIIYDLFIEKYLPDVSFKREFWVANWRYNVDRYFAQIRTSFKHPIVQKILRGEEWIQIPFVWEDYVDTEAAEKIHQDMVDLIEEEQAKRDAELTQGGKLAKIINFDIIRKIRNILK